MTGPGRRPCRWWRYCTVVLLPGPGLKFFDRIEWPELDAERERECLVPLLANKQRQVTENEKARLDSGSGRCCASLAT
jgi:hypothetical protein